MEASQTEMFGPVATVYRFDTEEDVIAQANRSEVGLVAYLYRKPAFRMEGGRSFAR